MRKRYLPFGYQIEQGEIAIVSKESNAVRFIFEEYLAGKSLKGIADIMSAKDMLMIMIHRHRKISIYIKKCGALNFKTKSGCTYKKHLDMKKKVCYTEEKSDDLTAG